MSDIQSRHWSDAFCGVRSGFTLFAHTCLSENNVNIVVWCGCEFVLPTEHIKFEIILLFRPMYRLQETESTQEPQREKTFQQAPDNTTKLNVRPANSDQPGHAQADLSSLGAHAILLIL